MKTTQRGAFVIIVVGLMTTCYYLSRTLSALDSPRDYTSTQQNGNDIRVNPRKVMGTPVSAPPAGGGGDVIGQEGDDTALSGIEGKVLVKPEGAAVSINREFQGEPARESSHGKQLRERFEALREQPEEALRENPDRRSDQNDHERRIPPERTPMRRTIAKPVGEPQRKRPSLRRPDAHDALRRKPPAEKTGRQKVVEGL